MFEFIYDYVERDTFVKYFRLTVLLCFYLTFRKYFSEWAKNKQVKRQLELDQKEKREKPEKEKQEKLAIEKALEEEAASFGWGKKTRKEIKLKQSILEDQLSELRDRHQSAYDAAEDHDIEDLLED